MAYFPSGQRIYCGSALDLQGIDPCSPNARPDFFVNLDSFLKDISLRPKQNIVKIEDISNNQSSTLNQGYAFPVKVEGETLSIIVLGVDIRKSLEVFEDEFEVRTAIKTPESLISLDDYFTSYGNDENNVFGTENFDKLTDQASRYRENIGARYLSLIHI